MFIFLITKWWNPHFNIFPHLVLDFFDPKSLATCSNLLVFKDTLNASFAAFLILLIFQFTFEVDICIVSKPLQFTCSISTNPFSFYMFPLLAVYSTYCLDDFYMKSFLNVPNILIALTVTYTKLHIYT